MNKKYQDGILIISYLKKYNYRGNQIIGFHPIYELRGNWWYMVFDTDDGELSEVMYYFNK